MIANSHKPVMLTKVLQCLLQNNPSVVVDGTYGAGGHARALLSQLPAHAKMYGIDRDPIALNYLIVDPRFTFIPGNFSQIPSYNLPLIDALLLDLGPSSMQLDSVHRGFSFRHDSPLDMRMDQEGSTAKEVLQKITTSQLHELLMLVNEPKAYEIAVELVKAARYIVGTMDVVKIIQRCYGTVTKINSKHIATKTFLALRMLVNSELEHTVNTLHLLSKFMAPNGIVGIITFHSWEDRQVKLALKQTPGKSISFTPCTSEIKRNPRSRSARLRVLQLT